MESILNSTYRELETEITVPYTMESILDSTYRELETEITLPYTMESILNSTYRELETEITVPYTMVSILYVSRTVEGGGTHELCTLFSITTTNRNILSIVMVTGPGIVTLTTTTVPIVRVHVGRV